MAKTDRKYVRTVTKWLRENFPSVHPVRVVVRENWPDKDLWASCSRIVDGEKVRFLIRLRADRTDADVTSDLHHEFAHVLHMHMIENASAHDHDAVYWAIHGQIYALWHEEKPGSE